MSEFIQNFEKRVEISGNDTYLLYEDESYTYREFADGVWQIANGVLELGIEPGDHIAIMMNNSPEWLQIYFAMRQINVTVVPINIELRGDSLAYVLSDSDAKAVFLDRSTIEPYLDAADRIDTEIVVGGHEEMQSFQSLLSDRQSPPDVQGEEAYVPHILYTSGTTGRPKGVVNRLFDEGSGTENPLFELLQDQLGWSADDVLYTPWPLYHGNALLLSALPAFWLGATLALDPGFTASNFWDRIRHYGATEFHTLGAVNKILLKQPEREDDDDNPVRVVLTAGMPEDAWEEFEERFDVKIKEFYGAVDGPAFFVNRKNKPGSMGEPVFCEARIVDDDGNDLGVGEVGELWARSPYGERTFEYYKNKEATEETHEGAWFKTGDLVYKDEDDYYYFVDRKKFTIRRLGENISTYEVERAIEDHEDVQEACVYGIPSDIGEDEVATKIIPKEGRELEPEDVASFLTGRIADFKLPKYIEVTDSIRKTPTDRYKKMKFSEEGVTDDMWTNPEVT